MNKPPTETAAMSLDQLRQSVHAEIGQLLLSYQHIELMLKVLLPRTQGNADEDIDNLLDAQPTMALLIERLNKSVDMSGAGSGPDGLATYIAQITASRNELVHKFTMADFGGLDTEAKCSAAIDYLKAQHQYALPLRSMLLQLVSQQLKRSA